MRNIMACFAAMLGMLLITASAQAGTTNIKLNPFAISGATGYWTVTLDTTNNIDWTVLLTANTGAEAPNADVRTMTLTFYDMAVGGSIINGDSTASIGGGIDGTVNAGPPTTYATSGSDWNGFSNFSVTFDRDTTGGRNDNWLLAVPPPADVDPQGVGGGSYFTGHFSLVNASAKFVQIGIQDTGKQWNSIGSNNSGRVGLVPEASSFAMLLPALLPIGIVLRRKVAKN